MYVIVLLHCSRAGRENQRNGEIKQLVNKYCLPFLVLLQMQQWRYQGSESM